MIYNNFANKGGVNMTAREKIASVIMAVASILLSFGLLSFFTSLDSTYTH